MNKYQVVVEYWQPDATGMRKVVQARMTHEIEALGEREAQCFVRMLYPPSVTLDIHITEVQ